MDSDQQDSGRVDQLFTGYSSSGMRALASTFEDAELHRRWEQMLIHYVRLESFGRDDPPPCAFTYVTFDNGDAAILRRVRAGDSIGRNNAHALIGPVDVLGTVALDLTCWDNWVLDRPLPGLQPLTNQDLRVAANAADMLENAANDCAESAVPLLGCVLSLPRVKISSIAMDHERIVPTLRLFERVLKPLFSVERQIRSWSFSTYEVTDADQGDFSRPELIFLPKPPDHAGQMCHHRIFFDEVTQVESRYQKLARDLIEEYRRLGYEQYARAMNDRFGSLPNVEWRIQQLLSNGLDRQRYVPGSAHAAQPGFVPQPADDQKAEFSWTQAGRGDVRYGPRPVRTPADHGTVLGAPPVDSGRDVFDDEEIVRQLAEAQDEKEIDYWLAKLRRRIIDASATDDYRWTLIDSSEILRLLPSRLYLWDLIVAYGDVLEFAFGAGGKALHEPIFFGMVEKLIENTEVSLLFGCVVYGFVKDSRMGSHCARLLHQRSGELTSISLMPEVMNLSHDRSAAADWSDWLVALSRNSQIRILLILFLLVSIAVVSMIIVV